MDKFMKLKSNLLFAIMLAVLASLLLTACGGTKVYDTSKTIVYNGNIYQVTDVKQIGTRVEAVKEDRTIVNLKNKSKDDITALIKANEPLFVRMVFELDEQELIYSATDIDSYRDYSRMESRFEGAGDDIAKLMRAKKTEQLKLR